MIELVMVIVVGNVMIGPQLCQVDYLHNGQIYTIEEKCQENSIPHIENPGTL
jgi:hypothetical protein